MARPKALHTACAALVLAACLLGCASPARAHGYLKQPASRNYRASLLPHGTDREYCPHCLGSRDDNMPVCGFGRYMSPQSVTDTYTEGQVIDVTITATVVHLGRFELRLCPRPDSPNWQCFDMPQHALTRADNVRYGSKYWYFESAGDGSNGGAQSYGVGDFNLRFKLPDGVTCEHCTMQFFWQAGNDCAPTPCNDDPRYRPGQPCGAGYSHRRTCSSRFDSELFLNCADVRIVPRSGGPTPQPTPRPTPQPTPAPLPSSGGPVTDPWGQCGAGMATCPSGYCCSEWGWCGSSSDHCSSGCQSAYGSCWGGPTPTPTPTPTPQPAPQPRWTDPCTKCNLPGDQGGCKCDSNCACVVVDNGNPCTKCNLPEDQGGCKCDSNCACAADFANPCTKCNLPVSEGGCKCDSNCDCRP